MPADRPTPPAGTVDAIAREGGSKRPRIDAVTWPDGSAQCLVVIPGVRTIHRTRRYTREDRDGTVPFMRAMRAAQKWLEQSADAPERR